MTSRDTSVAARCTGSIRPLVDAHHAATLQNLPVVFSRTISRFASRRDRVRAGQTTPGINTGRWRELNSSFALRKTAPVGVTRHRAGPARHRCRRGTASETRASEAARPQAACGNRRLREQTRSGIPERVASPDADAVPVRSWQRCPCHFACLFAPCRVVRRFQPGGNVARAADSRRPLPTAAACSIH